MSDNNYSAMLGNYWDYASDTNIQSNVGHAPPPPIPPRPETSSGLEQLWKSYRKTVENKVAKKLGPRSANVGYDTVTISEEGSTVYNSNNNNTERELSPSRSSIRDQVAALRRDTAMRKNNYFRQQEGVMVQSNSNNNTPEISRQNRSPMSTSAPPRRVSPSSDKSPAFNLSDIRGGGGSRSSTSRTALNSKELENAKKEIENMQEKLKLSNLAVERLKAENAQMKKSHQSMIQEHKNNSTSSQEELILKLNQLKGEFKTKEVVLRKKLEESNTNQVEMKTEMKNVQNAFENFKKSANAELSTTLIRADKTISDLSNKLRERKKMLKKFDNEVKRLNKEIKNYKLIVNKKSNIVGDNASDDKQKNTITHEEEIFKLKEQCTAYKYNIDDMSKLNKKLQNEIDDQKVELELNVELEEKMNALHREYSVLQKKYQRKVEDYDGMKEMFEKRSIENDVTGDGENDALNNSTTNQMNRVQVELTECRQKLKFKEEEYENMMNQLDKAKKRRLELDEIVKSTKESLYDVQDQKENIELKLNRTFEEKDRLESLLEKLKIENNEFLLKLKDNETNTNENEIKLNAEITNLKEQDASSREKHEKLAVQLKSEKEMHNVAKEKLKKFSQRYEQANEENDSLKAKLQSSTEECNSVKASYTESQEMLQKMTLEKDQLHEKCEKLKDDLSRSGSDIELNLVRGDLKDVKIALDELKKSSQEKEKALLKDIEAQKKKISKLEIEDKINKQELDKTQNALGKAKDLVKKLQNRSAQLTKSQILSSSDENPYDDDFDRDSEDEEDAVSANKTNNKNAAMEHKTPKTSSKVNNSNVSDISNWDSSVKKKKPSSVSSTTNPISNSNNKEKKAISDMDSFFKISDDDLDESGTFGEGNSEFSFSNSKDTSRKGTGENLLQKTKKQSKLSPKRDEQDYDDDESGDESEDEEDVSTTVEQNTKNADNDDNHDEEDDDDEEEEEDEDDDDEDEDSGEEETDDEEEEKHGWEKMDHKGKEYYWNWDTEETVWERPDDYNSSDEVNSGSSDEEYSDGSNEQDAENNNNTKGKGPAALFLEHMKKNKGNEEPEDENEESIFNRFLDEIEEGIAIRKFPSSGKLFGKSAPQDRTLWLDRKRNVLYWQKGRKNKSKVKLESSIRLDDLISVSVGLKSEGLKKNGIGKNADLYMTLIGKGGGRDLDIEARDTEQRNYLANSFKQLLKAKR